MIVLEIILLCRPLLTTVLYGGGVGGGDDDDDDDDIDCHFHPMYSEWNGLFTVR